jgi:uncharacterized protein YdcH (DUF465 family)
MSKDKLRELLSQLWLQDISADEAFDELEDLINRIKRLEEAGDALANTQTYDLLATVNWRKAKEAKP